MKRLLNFLIILLVIDLLGVGMLWFAYATIENKKTEETELQGKLSGETQKSLQLTSLRRTVEQAQKESLILKEYFYDASDESQIKFVADIEALGVTTRTNAEIKTFNLAAGVAPGFAGSLSFSGEWQNVYHLLRLLETFPARLVLTNFTAKMVSEKGGVFSIWDGTTTFELKSVQGK